MPETRDKGKPGTNYIENDTSGLEPKQLQSNYVDTFVEKIMCCRQQNEVASN